MEIRFASEMRRKRRESLVRGWVLQEQEEEGVEQLLD